MNIKQELQKQNNKLDKLRHRLDGAKTRNDHTAAAQIQHEMVIATKKIASLKSQQTRTLSSKGGQVSALAFNRAITKAEQADMGKLKKSVKGLVVVHPLTALGREMKIEVITGFAPKPF
jgi:ribosome-associated protein